MKVKHDHRSKFSNISNWKEEAWKNQVWLHSSGGRASHRYRGDHGFESCWSPDFFRLLLCNCLNWKILLRWSCVTFIFRFYCLSSCTKNRPEINIFCGKRWWDRKKFSCFVCVDSGARHVHFRGVGGGVVTRQPLVHLVSLRHKLSGRQVTGSIAHYLVTGNLDKSRSMSVFFFFSSFSAVWNPTFLNMIG